MVLGSQVAIADAQPDVTNKAIGWVILGPSRVGRSWHLWAFVVGLYRVSAGTGQITY